MRVGVAHRFGVGYVERDGGVLGGAAVCLHSTVVCFVSIGPFEVQKQ